MKHDVESQLSAMDIINNSRAARRNRNWSSSLNIGSGRSMPAFIGSTGRSVVTNDLTRRRQDIADILNEALRITSEMPNQSDDNPELSSKEDSQ
jgi:hypothetical protein